MSTDRSHGEFVAIRERVLVSPVWGRLEMDHITPGQGVEEGTIIGHLRSGATEIPLTSPVRGVFLAWLVLDGERIPPGTPLAWFRSGEGGSSQ